MAHYHPGAGREGVSPFTLARESPAVKGRANRVRYRYGLSNSCRRLPAPCRVLPLAGRVRLIKSRGDRGRAPYGKGVGSTTFGTLIPTVVASNPLNLAIADTLVGANLDKFHNYHFGGNVNKLWTSSSFHDYCVYVPVRTSVRLDAVPPLG